MKIFITGATGYIGFAVASALSAKGHQVYGLTRSAENSKKLASREIQPVIGSMNDPSSYLSTAQQCQVLIHCAVDWSEQLYVLDRKTVEELLKLAAQSSRQRTIIYTSGVWLYGNTQNEIVDEASDLNPPTVVSPRLAIERILLQAAKNNVATISLRPGCVYGQKGGLTGMWFASALQRRAQIIGDGNFRWSMVHIEDLADAYVKAAESAFAGEIFNVTDRSRFTILECAQAASFAAGKNGEVDKIALEEALKVQGPIVECLTLNQHVDSSKAARLLGWQPRHGGFVDGVERYFNAWKALNS
jgi:nucleoside-diphosphate-sugar epimerase